MRLNWSQFRALSAKTGDNNDTFSHANSLRDTARLLFSVTQGKINSAPQDILATRTSQGMPTNPSLPLPLPPQPNNE